MRITAGLVSSQHTHHSLALYVTILELWAFGREYAAQMLKNAQALGRHLRAAGFKLIERGGQSSDSQMHPHLRPAPARVRLETGRWAEACTVPIQSQESRNGIVDDGGGVDGDRRAYGAKGARR